MKVVQNGMELCSVQVADSFGTRLKGLMFKKNLPEKSGLLIRNCSSIHTCFMRFPIDVLYLDKDYELLHAETVPPWRVGTIVPHTRHVLELPQGAKKNYIVGYQIQLIET